MDWDNVLREVEDLVKKEVKNAENLAYDSLKEIMGNIKEEKPNNTSDTIHCPYCEELITDVCGKLEEDARSKCETAIATITKEKISADEAKKATKTLREIGVFEEVWEKANKILKELKQEQPRGQVSYQGQTAESYCLECLAKHYGAAVRLLEEARDFSMREGKVTPEARRKIRKVIEEIAGSEDDLGVESRDREFNDMLNKIREKQRELRKWLWSSRLPTVEEDASKINEAISKAKELTDLVYQAAEMYERKFGK